eukprot:c9639_g1_i1.p1 GENE.c9639_g1_i1~~c9639_g1_i1.p1  ORF type:complete len:307 (+),score=44.09 c9639_g1_i1:145-1065(+)
MQSFVMLLFKFTLLKTLRARRVGNTNRAPRRRFEQASVLSRRLQLELNVSESVFVFAGALVQNMYSTKPQLFRELSATEIVVAACTLAIKFLDQLNMGMQALARLVGMPNRHLLWLERRVFQVLKFNAYVSIEAYSRSMTALMAMSNTAFVCLSLDDPFGSRMSDRPLRRLDLLEYEVDHPPLPPQLPSIDTVLRGQPTPPEPDPGSEVLADGLSTARQAANQARQVGWDGDEDEKLLYLIQRHGVDNWDFIALFLGRTSEDCRLRYDRMNPTPAQHEQDTQNSCDTVQGQRRQPQDPTPDRDFEL